MDKNSEMPCSLVIFGASGDLTRRKLMPALYHLFEGGHLPEGFRIVGYGRSAKTDEEFRNELFEGVQSFSHARDKSETSWQQFAKGLHYVSGGYDDTEALGRLQDTVCRDRCKQCRRVLYYFALPPSASEVLLQAAGESRLNTGDQVRLLMEKPFGTDLPSARRLNSLLGSQFQERQIYRIDHYVAKDTVRNLLAFRFTNAIFEPLWNRNYIDNIQITAAEEIGIEGRGGYYEESGVVRDMLQNHVLQVLSLVAMDPPIAGGEESVRNKKAEIFEALRPLTDKDFVFGQYNGYRDETGCAPDSLTPTYAAMRLFIDNWRWQGVPFYLRSGKALQRKITEVVIQFKRVPLCILDDEGACKNIRPNILVMRIQPDEGISLQFNMQQPGHTENLDVADLGFRYTELESQPGEAYEKVIVDAMKARSTLFWRSDSIEAAWRAVTPLLATGDIPADTFPNYEPGSWGPASADQLLMQDGRYWHETY